MKATGDIFILPYQEFRRQPQSPSNSVIPKSSGGRSPSVSSKASSSIVTTNGERQSKMKTTGTAIGASAKSLGKAVGHSYKGMLIDVPLAVSEGLRAVPRLYGDEVKDHGAVRDWKSGAVFAGKNFTHGMAEGLSDIFVQPYKGGRQEGAKGVMKGLAKGALGATTKVSSGTSEFPLNRSRLIVMDQFSGVGAGSISSSWHDEKLIHRNTFQNPEEDY
jgi:hypothetical protein